MSAVTVRDAYKYYGDEKNKNVILNRLNMNVFSGTIYGLLGTSGCGKTTLLSCILGMIALNEGEISIFGQTIGSKRNKSINSRIGYMPQELGLIAQLTIKESIFYFGKIFFMKHEKICERFLMLSKLLELPPSSRKIEECSGGEMRRISFAVSMIHDPELLILDEPTVGVDPLLREKIWNFLVEISQKKKVTIIITTHYIEEARQADRISFLRDGNLLLEGSTKRIIDHFQVETLDEVFLNLCMRKENSKLEIPGRSVEDLAYEDVINSNFVIEEMKEEPTNHILRWAIIQALIVKNWVQMKRHTEILIFMLLLPILTLIIFYNTVGGLPKGLKIGIFNEEVRDYKNCLNSSLVTTHLHDYECDLYNLSCRFLEEITDDIASKVFYDKFEDAYVDAKNNKITGFIHIPSNFTESLVELINSGLDSKEETTKNAVYNVYLDQSDLQIFTFLKRKLYDAYSEYSQKILVDCGRHKKALNSPLSFEKPIYGNLDSDFSHSQSIPTTVVFIFYFSTTLTAALILQERQEGFWNRSILAGVSSLEIIVGPTILYFGILIIQVAEAIGFLVVIFKIGSLTSISLLTLIFALIGLNGLFFGMAFSCVCKNFTETFLLSNLLCALMTYLVGMMWPIQAMSPFLQYITVWLPPTLPSLAVIDIIYKEFTICDKSVIIGIVVSIMWQIVLVILSTVLLERKRFSRNS